MKKHSKISFIAIALVLSIIVSGCNDILKETPRSSLTPDYYSTGAGLSSGLTSVYSSFRNYYGNEGGMNMLVYGTDEFTHGQQVSNPALNVYSTQLNSTLGDLTAAWNNAFPAINTCNGIIDRGPLANDLTASQKTQLIAEAKYLRAQWYFILVNTFGPVTLDLGSGPLKFNTTATNVAARAPIADVWAAIIKDLTEASAELPDKPSTSGHVFKASALHLLAKAYLTRGYSTAAAASDFTDAYNTANTLITNKATYGVSLLPDYRSVHAEGNEYNAEVLFAIGWLDNQTFNPNNGFASAQNQNRSNFFYRCLYVTNTPGMIRDVTNGRPFVRYKPTEYTLEVAFADKVNDTRYSKSFQTVWYANSATQFNPTWTAGDVASGAVTQKAIGTVLQPAVAGQQKLAVGDTAIWMVPSHLTAKFLPVKNLRSYVMFFSDLAAGLPAGTAAATTPSAYFNTSVGNSGFTNYAGYDRQQNQYYPSLSKYNATQFRAGNDPNISSVRPFIVHRFAETYLIAAEAAVQLGNSANAVAMLNVVRARAGVGTNGWGGNGNSGALTAATPAAPTLDYVLDERTRELAGEAMRWFDLVRTGKLVSRINLYNNYPPLPGTWNNNGVLSGTAQNTPAPQAFHVLRPIPQNQIDGAVDPSGGKYPQNTGY